MSDILFSALVIISIIISFYFILTLWERCSQGKIDKVSSYFLSVAVISFGILLVLLYVLRIDGAYARNLGQFDSDTDRARWFRSLVAPDTGISCCGPQDAYYCDDLHTRDGKNYCAITDDRDDAPLGRVHIDIGTEIEIPDSKILTTKEIHGENPTGHYIIFLTTSRFVWCFVMGTGL